MHPLVLYVKSEASSGLTYSVVEFPFCIWKRASAGTRAQAGMPEGIGMYGDGIKSPWKRFLTGYDDQVEIPLNLVSLLAKSLNNHTFFIVVVQPIGLSASVTCHSH
jgi:hypothetical protein